MVYPEKQVTHINHGGAKTKASIYPEQEFKQSLTPTKTKFLSIAKWETV